MPSYSPDGDSIYTMMNKTIKEYRFHEIIRQIDVLNSESDWEVLFSHENVSLIDDEQSFRY